MESGNEKQKMLTILATSDLHGKFYPWNYALNENDLSGSMAQLLPAIRERYHKEDTILVDAGDTIQDNAAEIFLDEKIHPMIAALNYLGYDVWTSGNHDYNFGLDDTKRCIEGFAGKALIGNVYERSGRPLADGYTILERSGIRVAVIGMVTPNIDRWDRANLAGCRVTDPVEETGRILEKIDGQYDVLIGALHMGLRNEYGRPDSGIDDFTRAFPQFDLIVGAHEHFRIEGQEINGVTVVENREQAQTMCEVTLTLSPHEAAGKWRVTDRKVRMIDVSTYAPDGEFLRAFAPYHERAVRDAEKAVGVLKGGPLVPPDEIKGIPTAQIQDTALSDLINEVQLYYSGADVSACCLYDLDANIQPGPIRKCDVAHIYKHPNTLVKLKMTGAQLKRYMEWSARYYNTFRAGDLTVSFNPEIRAYSYDIFSGVNYEIDISREAGSRIRNLCWPDGRPVQDAEELTVAVSNYRYAAQLSAPGEVYSENEALPVLMESEVSSYIGGIRELIMDYIVIAKDRVIIAKTDHNWRLTGMDWDPALHQRVAELAAAGLLKIEASANGRTPNIRPVREEDLVLAVL